MPPNPSPSTLACIECRRKHIKCDATTTPCARCARRGLRCQVLPSRRGRRKANSHHLRTTPGIENGNSDDLISGAETTALLTPGSTSVQAQAGQSGEHRLDEFPRRPDEDLLVGLYYLHFHHLHPFLLPRSSHAMRAYPDSLKLAMQLLGSQYNASASAELLEMDFTASLNNDEPSMFKIQSLLLYAFFLYAQDKQEEVATNLTKAIEMAIELDLHQEHSASTYGTGDPVMQESCRRTWWELYIMDAFLSTVHRIGTFRCNKVEITTGLPCEEDAYLDEMPPPTAANLEQLDGRFFADEEQSFSSACHRIEAARLMGRVYASINTDKDPRTDVRAVDNAIAAWKIHLPPSKLNIVSSSGAVDYMLLQAHSIVHMASIILHFPRSELPAMQPSAASIACAARMTPASSATALHASKALDASKDIADLAALPISKHSGFFVPILCFACVVQLAACTGNSGSDLVVYRDRVALMTGVMKSMAMVWPQVREVSGKINRVARSIFAPHTAATSFQTPLENIDIDDLFNDLPWLQGFPDGFNAPWQV